MWFLWIFGDNIEDHLGHFRYLLFYLLSGLGAAFAQLVLNPHSRVPTVGASRAILGVSNSPFFFNCWPGSEYVLLTNNLAALRPRGMMVLYGASSGQVPPFDPQRLNSGGSLFLTRPTLVHYIADPAELRLRAGEVLEVFFFFVMYSTSFSVLS